MHGPAERCLLLGHSRLCTHGVLMLGGLAMALLVPELLVPG